MCGVCRPIDHEGVFLGPVWMVCMGCEVTARERALRPIANLDLEDK